MKNFYIICSFKPQTNKDMLTEITHSRHDAMVSFDAAGYCKYNTTSVETAGRIVFASLKKKSREEKKTLSEDKALPSGKKTYYNNKYVCKLQEKLT